MTADDEIDVSELAAAPPGRTELSTRLGASSAEVTRLRVAVVEGPDAGLSVESTHGRLSIGTHASNDLTLTDRSVSRFHCELELDRQGAWVRDLESTNGTELDGVRLGRGGVRESSWLRLGRSTLQLHFAEPLSLPLSECSSFGSLVGSSPAMRRVFALLQRAAESDATVLIHGETGTGKEGAAEAIHQQGARSRAPFVVVDCSALPANLLEAELFGHEAGAYTGALKKRLGAFQQASGGTIFLDELGELPLELQPKLLRVLEERKVRPLGSDHYRPVDVRVLAATHRDLRQLVNQGSFRADLYYRLAVVLVTLPALRERPEDIPLLAKHLAESLVSDPAVRTKVLDDTFYRRLERASWPGNVRELRNYVERCLVMQQVVPLQSQSETPAPNSSHDHLSFGQAKALVVEEFERNYLRRLLERSNGNLSQAARTANLDRPHLYKLLNRYGLRNR